jgi:hypothetical protein
MNITANGNFMFSSSAIDKLCGLIESGLLDLPTFEHILQLGSSLEDMDCGASDEIRAWLYSIVVEP